MAESRAMLQKYSIGVVAANKALGSNIIEVMPAEHFPMADGELTTNATAYQASGTDASGTAYTDSVQSALTVKAEWIPLGSMNRITAPDVRRAERVQLYRYADSDKFYWTTLTDDTGLRRLETVTHAYSGTSDESTTALTADNSYYSEVSTHKGLVHFHTSKANKEPFAYDIQINAASGYVAVQDDVGNAFRLDSANCQIFMQNAQGASLVLDKKNGTLTIPETYTINCKDYVLAASNSYTVTSQTGKMSFSNLTITANTTHNGNIALAGNLTTIAGSGGSTGSIDMAGDMNLRGNMQLDGVISADQGANFGGTVKANVIISVGNIQAPNV